MTAENAGEKGRRTDNAQSDQNVPPSEIATEDEIPNGRKRRHDAGKKRTRVFLEKWQTSSNGTDSRDQDRLEIAGHRDDGQRHASLPLTVSPANAVGVPTCEAGASYMDDLYTEEEAAALLGMSIRMIADRRRAGKIGTITDGQRFIRYKKEHLEAYLRAQHRGMMTEEMDPSTLLGELRRQLLVKGRTPLRRSRKKCR